MTTDSNALTIREAGAADAATLRRLAGHDRRRAPEGRVLVADVDGETVAAAPVAGGPTLVDPLQPQPSPANLIELRVAAAALREHISTRAAARRGASRRIHRRGRSHARARNAGARGTQRPTVTQLGSLR